MVRVNESILSSLYSEIAAKLGASTEESEIWSRCMVRADLRGMYTQGAAMIPYSVWLMRNRLARFGVVPKVLEESTSTALVDGGNGVGPVVATRAMKLAVEKAQSAGLACVWVQNSGDFMMAANYTLQAVEHDMVGLAMRNGSPHVAPWGGMEPFFSTDPISVAVPANEEPPIVIDMASGSYSIGHVVMAARDERRLASAHLFTADGEYTDDPKKIVVDPADRESDLRGGIVSFGHKGLAWLMIVEILSALLSGMNTSNMNNYRRTGDNPWKEGMFHMAIDVSKLRPISEFKASVDSFVRDLRNVKPARGFDQVIVPGEVEARNEEERRKTGIPIRDEDWEGVVQVATDLGITIDSHGHTNYA